MTVKAKKKAQTQKILLQGELTISEAGSIARQFTQVFAGHDEVIIEIGAVESVDLTFLQIICSAHQTAIKTGKTMKLGEIKSQRFLDFHKDAGFVRNRECCSSPAHTCVWNS